MTFIELPLFTKQITDLLDDVEYGQFQAELIRSPDKGNVIAQSGGLRKVRMRLPGGQEWWSTGDLSAPAQI